jgi:hypothetical protein
MEPTPRRLIESTRFPPCRPRNFCGPMPPFLYRCPNTGYRVQGFVAEDVSEDPESYQAVTCIACQQVHLVNPTSGRVLGGEEE